MKVQSDWEIATKFINEMSQILRRVVGRGATVTLATEDQDQKEATDLIVRAPGLEKRVGCRVRRHEFLEQYPWEFTLRWLRESGSETEHSKIGRGYCDWQLYAFSDEFRHHLLLWRLINLDVLRRSGVQPIKIFPNKDGQTWGAAYDLRKFSDQSILVATGWCPENAQKGEW